MARAVRFLKDSQVEFAMGDSVEEIAEKSGFSKTTVRRRVKMLELDQGTLKEVSERQLSLTDFDELAKIEDVKARNACLAEIGTANFNQTVTTQLRQQAIKKKLSPIKKQLKSSKAKALKQSDTWSGKYESLNAEIIIPDWDGESRVIPEKVSGQLYGAMFWPFSGKYPWAASFLQDFGQLGFDLRLRFAEDVFDDAFTGGGIVASGVTAFPAAIASLADISFTVGAALCHYGSLLSSNVSRSLCSTSFT